MKDRKAVAINSDGDDTVDSPGFTLHRIKCLAKVNFTGILKFDPETL